MEIQRTEQRLLYEIAGTPHSYRAWVLVLTVLILSGCEKKEAASPPGPPEVQVVEVSKQDVPIYSDWVAQLNGDVNAEIVPKVQGYVLNRNYDEGGFVQKGQLLFEIDPRPFQAALEQTKAQLANAEAELSKADKDLARDAPLVAQEAIPRKQLDNDKAALATAEAQVGAAQAQVAQAELNLNWTKVHSPIDGIAGTANAQVGDLVGPTTKMTTISTVDPIRAYFSVSEDVYLQYSDRIRAVVRGIPKAQPLTVEYIDATGSRYPRKGRIILVNREVNSQTGTIQIAVEFRNPDGVLRPGGIGRVRIMTVNNKNALLIPQRAVMEVQAAYQVLIVGPDNKVSVRPVKVGDKVGLNWIITDGLNPGETVVVEGLMKVRDGMAVSTKPFVETASVGDTD